MTPEMQITTIGENRWLVATCKELPEVIIHGASIDQIKARAPNVVQRALYRRAERADTN